MHGDVVQKPLVLPEMEVSGVVEGDEVVGKEGVHGRGLGIGDEGGEDWQVEGQDVFEEYGGTRGPLWRYLTFSDI